MDVINEVRIRNVNAASIKRIDQMAKEIGISRNEFLRKQIDILSLSEQMKDYNREVEYYFQTILTLIEDINDEIKELRFKINEMEINKDEN